MSIVVDGELITADTYTEKMAKEICAAIASNPCGISTLLKDPRYKHFPAKKTIYGWQSRRPEFAKRCKEAMDARCLPIEDLILEVAMGEDDSGNKRLTKEEIARDKLVVDTLKWKLEKLMRHRYGDTNALLLSQLQEELAEIKALKEKSIK